MEAMMQLLRIFARPLAAVWMLTALGAAAHADPIPQAELDINKKTCMEACTGKGRPEETCTRYCDCSIKKLSEQMTLEEYQAGAVAIRKHQNPSQASLDKLIAIAKSCTAESQ
jgi:uncharacterized membrane protein